MAHLNAFIAACPAYGWSGGPEFKTRIKVLLSGRERRNADWRQCRFRYTLPFLNIGVGKYTAIAQMFYSCHGMLHNFLYRDPLDNVAQEEEFGIGDGTTTSFQLSKLSATDGVFYQREVYALYTPADDGSAVPAVLVVTVNGTPTAVTIDYERGIVTFAVAPAYGTVLRWSGSFAVWVRFDQDWLPFSIDNRRDGDDYARNGQVQLVSDAPPAPEVVS